VQVDVLAEGLPPGVQDGRHPHVAAEMAGIAGKGGEGRGGGAEEQVVEEPRVVGQQAIEGVRQREDDVEVFHGEELSAAGL